MMASSEPVSPTPPPQMRPHNMIVRQSPNLSSGASPAHIQEQHAHVVAHEEGQRHPPPSVGNLSIGEAPQLSELESDHKGKMLYLGFGGHFCHRPPRFTMTQNVEADSFQSLESGFEC